MSLQNSTITGNTKKCQMVKKENDYLYQEINQLTAHLSYRQAEYRLPEPESCKNNQRRSSRKHYRLHTRFLKGTTSSASHWRHWLQPSSKETSRKAPTCPTWLLCMAGWLCTEKHLPTNKDLPIPKNISYCVMYGSTGCLLAESVIITESVIIIL